MSETKGPSSCERCGGKLSTTAPEGLCPRCLARSNLWTDTGAPGEPASNRPKPPVPPALSPAELAKLFPHLEVLECLGRGGMGAVYKARQPLLKRVVALKVLAPEKENDAQFAERFMREAQALGRLNHPGIVAVHDFGEVQGLCYLLMEFVDGMSLRQLLRDRKLLPEETLAIVPPMCEALQYAHEQGVVHRDIKPENILLEQQGRVKIADFGIAKIMGQPAEERSLTAAREVVGTPYYMAPEQVEQPAKVDHRADIYSLGVVLYEMLTGELPLGKFTPPSRKAPIDRRLDKIVLRALEKEPERRYQDANQFKTDVAAVAASTRRVSPVSPQELRASGVRRKLWDGLVCGLAAALFGFLFGHFYIWLPGMAAALLSAFQLGFFRRGVWWRVKTAGAGWAIARLAAAVAVVLLVYKLVPSPAHDPALVEAATNLESRAPSQAHPGNRTAFLESVFGAWAKQDTAAALRAAEQLADPMEREIAVRAVRNIVPAGIGVVVGLSPDSQLKSQAGYPVINRLVPGTPAQVSGQLRLGDRIIAIAEGEASFVDARSFDLQEFVRAMRGTPGTRIRLQVLSADAPADTQPRTVTLVRGPTTPGEGLLSNEQPTLPMNGSEAMNTNDQTRGQLPVVLGFFMLFPSWAGAAEVAGPPMRFDPPVESSFVATAGPKLVLLFVVGFIVGAGALLGYLMARSSAQSPWQRMHALKFWSTLAIGYAAFVIPVLSLAGLAIIPGHNVGAWTAMAWWMNAMYVVLLAALILWVRSWWRDLPPSPTSGLDIPGPAPSRLVKWTALGSALPAMLLVLSLYSTCFSGGSQLEALPLTAVERIVNEAKDARFAVESEEDGSKTLFIRLPGRKHILFHAPADDAMLKFLSSKGVVWKHQLRSFDHSLMRLGPGAVLLVILSGLFLAPAGAVLLWLQHRSRSAQKPAPARARPPAGLDTLLLALRTDRAPKLAFLYTSLPLLLASAGFLAWLVPRIPAPKPPTSKARVELETRNAKVFQREVATLKSEAIPAAARRLDLERKWSRASATRGQPFTNLLARSVRVWPDRANFEISIVAAGLDRHGAARLANAVAQQFITKSDNSRPAARLILRATPAPWTEDPQLRWIVLAAGVTLGLMVAMVTGGIATVVCVLVRGRKRSGGAAHYAGSCKGAGAAGFTLIELLVVIAIIGILVSLLLPALTRGKQKAQGVYCLNNCKQMMAAIVMYTGDHHDLFLPNPDDGNRLLGHNWVAGKTGIGQPEEFNPDILRDKSRSLLTSYLSDNISVFHCPGDTRSGLYKGTDPTMLGRVVSSTRTFSMNQAVGTICPGYDGGENWKPWNYKHSGAPTLAVNGPWLDGRHTHRRNSPWRTYGKLADIAAPGPAMLWILVDEDLRGLNDGAFAFTMTETDWLDAPGTYHNGGCGFAFADGHSESHRWHSPIHTPMSKADPQDWQWMRDRTSAMSDR